MTSSGRRLQPGDRLDQYELERVVATSGMATVYRAHELGSGRVVAIKVPHPEVESDPALSGRFAREQEIGAAIAHPGVMKVYPNPGRSQTYMVMEWLDGRLLRAILAENQRLPVTRAVKLTLGICAALEHIHAHGIVHRDLKPENVMVMADDEVRLIDFGIAAQAGARRLTFAKFSQNLGTPDYISPEQVRGKRGDARSDLFALGVMLYEMLTGQVPFTGVNPFAAMNDRLLNPPQRPRSLAPAISPQLEKILYRALAREPRHRYHSAREFAQDLEDPENVAVPPLPVVAMQRREPSPHSRRLLVYAALLLVPCLLFALLWVISRGH
jgi:serine/threonine-protein kinase